MKKTIVQFAGLCALLALLASCFQVVNDAPKGTGQVEIRIAGSAGRTLFPDMNGFTYTAVFTASGMDTVTNTITAGTTTLTLLPGTWDLEVQAKSGTVVIGTSSVSGIEVKNGDTTQVPPIVIVPASGANGTLAWKADFPAVVTDAKLYLSDSSGATLTDYNGLDILTASAGKVAVSGTERSGTVSLSPGSYLIRLRLSDGTQSAGAAEAVHIFAGQPTAAEKTYSAADFSATTVFGGSVAIVHSDKINVTSAELKLYETNTDTIPFDTLSLVKDTGDAWIFTGGVPQAYTPPIFAEVSVTTANTTLVTAKQSVASVTTGVTLSAVNIYALTASVGAGGTLKIDGSTVANGVQIDVLDGTSVALEAAPNGGYEIDTPLDPATSPYTVTADTTVSVTFKKSATVDPNLIWQWSYATNGGPSGTFTNSGTNATLTGTGEYTAVPVRIMSNNTVSEVTGLGGGILIDASGATGRFLIGSSSNTTTSFSATDSSATFDFLTENKPVKVSLDYKITGSAAAAGRALWILVNNNQSGMQDTSPLNNGTSGAANNSTASRILATSALLSENDSGTFTGTLDVSSITNGKATLEHAFVNIVVLGGTGTNSGAKVLITGIKIEYVP